MHQQITLKATKTIIDKTGRLPKERLCLQDIGISDSLVPQFLEYAFDFMQEFTTSVEHPEKIEVRFEEVLLDDHNRLPLIMLALEQGVANSKLLDLHTELLRVLHIIAFFNLKYSKPIERLFNSMENVSFFVDIRKPLAYEIAPADLLLRKERTTFLCKIVAEAVSLIREDQNDVFLDEHLRWMDLVLKLVEIWQLNRIDIRQQQVSLKLYQTKFLMTLVRLFNFMFTAGILMQKIS